MEVFIQPSRRVSCPGIRSGGLEVFVQPSRRVSLRMASHMAQTRSPSTVSSLRQEDSGGGGRTQV